MKKYLKNIYINIILIILAFISLLITSSFIFSMPLLYAFFILMIIAYVYEQNSIKNKEYHFSNIYKIIYTSCCLLNCLYIAFFKNGWDVLGILGIDIIIILAFGLNVLVRIFFRLKYKQKFNLKNNLKQTIIFIILSIITVVVPIVIINL